jgi:hypothetical protein
VVYLGLGSLGAVGLLAIEQQQRLADGMSAVCCLLSAIYCLLPAVCCLLSAACYLLSTVCCLLSRVWCLLSAVECGRAAGCRAATETG